MGKECVWVVVGYVEKGGRVVVHKGKATEKGVCARVQSNLKKTFKVPCSKATTTLSLNYLQKHGGSILDTPCKELQKVALLIHIQQNV